MSDERWSETILEGFFSPDQAENYHDVPFEMPAHVRRAVDLGYLASCHHPRPAGPLDISVRAAGVMAQAEVTASDQTFEFELPVTQNSYIRAQLVDTGDDMIQALTNPIYFE